MFSNISYSSSSITLGNSTQQNTSCEESCFSPSNKIESLNEDSHEFYASLKPLDLEINKISSKSLDANKNLALAFLPFQKLKKTSS